jgi:hypothetical protein
MHKTDTIIVNRQAQLSIESLKAHTNATATLIGKCVFNRICHKLIDDQAQWYGLLHVKWEAIDFAFDVNLSPRHHLLEIITEFTDEGRAINRHVMVSRSQAPMHARHHLDLFNRRIQGPFGFDIAN